MVVLLLFVQCDLFVRENFVLLFCNVVFSIISSFACSNLDEERDLALYLYCALAALW